MEDVEVYSIVSSDSNSTIIDEHWSTEFPSTTFENGIKTNKNIYDLSDFETENACKAPYGNKKQDFARMKTEEILEELSKKYLKEKPLPNNEILLSDSSSETECNINHKENVSVELGKDNTLFENCFSDNINSFLLRNQIVDNNKMSLYPVASSSSEEIYNENIFSLKRTNESSSSDEDKQIERKTEKKDRQKRIATYEKRVAVEERKAMKEKEKIKKKEQLEKEKALKKAQRTIDKSLKPDDCLKFIEVNVDDSIFNNKEYGAYLKEHFSSKNITYLMKTSLPGMISWTRNVLSIENTEVKKSNFLEKHYAVIIKPEAFGNLLLCIQSIKEQTHFQHLSIFVYGQSKLTSSQEDEIMDIETQFPTYWQFVKNKEDLGSFLFMLTKSIAQIPYKKEQEAKFSHQSEYLENFNKKLVKVDKDGHGLGQLWRQMLTMFPLVRLETAEAITSVYPTPRSMFEAYENCTEPGEQLIQNLQIRRTQGPLASNRRIGPELSKKCYRFFTSTENSLL